MGTKTGTKRLFPDGKQDPRKQSGKTQNHFRFCNRDFLPVSWPVSCFPDENGIWSGKTEYGAGRDGIFPSRFHPYPPTPTPSVAGRNLNYRCKAVHSLPVSTTSYFRHVVSTVQSSIKRANNGTVLNRHRRRINFSLIHNHVQPFLRPVSISFYSTTHFKTIAKESRS